MGYISFAFIGFVLISIALYYIFPIKYRWIILLIASLAFYIINSSYLVLAIALSALSVYLGAKFIDQKNKEFSSKRKDLEKAQRNQLKQKVKRFNKTILTFVLIINIVAIAVMKYSGFIGENINLLLSLFKTDKSVNILEFAIPIGISYYTLMAISYIVDVYRGRISAEKNYFKLLLFLSFFPHIIEGPIGKYQKLSIQLNNGNHFDYNNFKVGIAYVLWGLTKKLIIADRIAIIVNEGFNNYNQYKGFGALIVIALYTIQIYADFSGCIDVVTGVSRFFGIRLSSNFEQPFLSKSVQEFWRRWHITFGVWLREYVFYPVSLSKFVLNISKKNKSSYFSELFTAVTANFCVWFVMGIWHGASWKYIFYGLYYFLIITLTQMFKPFIEKISNKPFTNSFAFDSFRVMRTSALVAIGMTIFRSNTINQAASMIINIFQRSVFISVSKLSFTVIDIIIAITFIILMVIINLLKKYKGNEWLYRFFSLPIIVRWCAYFLCIVLIITIGKYGPGYQASDFIYGGF